MGHGEEVKTRSQPQLEIQERGEIFFFYRPKVGKEQVQSAEDVQRLYVVLRPDSGEPSVQLKQDPHSGKEDAKQNHASSSKHGTEGGHGCQELNVEKEALFRLIVMGRKNLPNPSKTSQPYWGFVDLVTTKIDDLKDALGGEEYDASTRGHRQKHPARAVGEGVYRILRHIPAAGKRFHTHLVYKLGLPPQDKENEPQECLNIERQASFVIQIKNPDQPQHGRFKGLGNKRKTMFPVQLQAQFGHKRYSPADPPHFLNYEGCEFLLISASDDIEGELGLELKAESESDSDLALTFGETIVRILDYEINACICICRRACIVINNRVHIPIIKFKNLIYLEVYVI